MRLIDNARHWWRLWSVRLNAAGLAILAWVQFDPVSVLGVWNMMPADVRAALPEGSVRAIGMVLIALGLIARMVKQANLQGGTDARR